MSLDVESLPWATISLDHGDTDDERCRRLPVEHFEYLTAPVNLEGYRGYELFAADIALLVLPDNFDDWWNARTSRWMRSKVRRAQRLGYEFGVIDHDDRIDEICEINTSMPIRQGKEIPSYLTARPRKIGALPEQPCPRHREGWFGVLREGRLYAYIHAFQVGEVTFTPHMLAHGDYLDDGIMSLLLYEVACWHRRVANTRYVFYHYFESSHTDGLRFFKTKMGYVPHRVQWELNSRASVAPKGE